MILVIDSLREAPDVDYDNLNDAAYHLGVSLGFMAKSIEEDELDKFVDDL